MTMETNTNQKQPRKAAAVVTDNRRESSVITLSGWNAVSFRLEDSEEKTFRIQGEQGRYLQEGDQGVLTFQEGAFLSFEKANGETVGAMYYLPPQMNGEGHERGNE